MNTKQMLRKQAEGGDCGQNKHCNRMKLLTMKYGMAVWCLLWTTNEDVCKFLYSKEAEKMKGYNCTLD